MNPEFQLHVAIIKHHSTAFPHIGVFHIPNQTRDATEAFFNKMLGVRPGASDLILGWRGRNVGVVELKAPQGKLTTAQNKFLSAAHSWGWNTGVAKSVRQYHNILTGWGITAHHNAIREPNYMTKEDKEKAVFDMYARPGVTPKTVADLYKSDDDI